MGAWSEGGSSSPFKQTARPLAVEKPDATSGVGGINMGATVGGSNVICRRSLLRMMKSMGSPRSFLAGQTSLFDLPENEIDLPPVPQPSGNGSLTPWRGENSATFVALRVIDSVENRRRSFLSAMAR